MKPFVHLTFGLLLVMLTACEKELDFKYHDIDPITVIEGVLTPEGPRVAITLTTPMSEPMDRTLLTDATVSLQDLTEGQTFTLTPDKERYYTTGGLEGEPGHTYSLTVQRKGNRYEAQTEMYPATSIKSADFHWVKMPYDEVAVLRVRIIDNPEVHDECYWIKVYRNGKMYKWGEMNDHGVDGGVVTYMVMTTRRDETQEDEKDIIHNGDKITVEVCQISRDMYDYLEALQYGSDGPAMFDGPLSLGYFIATTPATTSLTFSR